MDRELGNFQQNYPAIPQKACATCGEKIVWRRRIATNWDRVEYCSASCRRSSVARAKAGFNAELESHDQYDAASDRAAREPFL